LHFLHNVGDLISDSHKVADGLWWGGDFDELQFLVEQKLISTENLRFFIGYTGWEKGQLGREILERTWILSESDPNYVFRTRPLSLWKKAMSLISETHDVIGTIPDYHFWN
jgi:putative transcriptional regulator